MKEKRGGPRKNTGPKPMYSEQTKTFAIKVPVSKFNEIRDAVRGMLEKYKI